MGLLLLQYLGLSFLVVFSSIKVSQCVDELDQRTNLGGALIGGILLAGVTSLPELMTSLASTMVLNNPDLAFGNILGSNAFNVFILAVFNIIFIKHMLFNKIGHSNKTTNVMNCIIYSIILFTFFSSTISSIGHVGTASVSIVFLYYLNLKITSNVENESTNKVSNEPVSKIIIRFILFSILIVGSSFLISIVTDQIARETGIGSSFVGAMFLGIATSLPEMSSLISLITMKNYDIAVGNIVGSNLFNFGIIAVTDVLYFSGNIFEIADISNSLLVFVGLFESLTLGIMLMNFKIKNKFLYALPSLLIILMYSYYIMVSIK